MTVLALDTSAEMASLALLNTATKELTEAVLLSTDGHSHRLFGEIQALLRRADVRLEDVDCFAAAAGPGSFTGVRVALAAAKGLATALGKPMAAVSNLQALAWFGTRPLRAALIDARRGDTYAALYDATLTDAPGSVPSRDLSVPSRDLSVPSRDREGAVVYASPENQLTPVRPEMVTRLDAWLAALPAGGDGEILTTNPALLAGHEPLPFPLRIVPPEQMARAVAHLAAGQMVDPALTDANYVRRADAEMNWVDR